MANLPIDRERTPAAEAPAQGMEPGASPQGPGRTLGRVGAVILVILLVLAIFAPAFARHDPLKPSGPPDQPPSAEHLLGTNDVGQDIFSQLLHGSRISLAIGALSALFAVATGLVVALLAGYLRGAADIVLMRVVDLTLAFPFLPLVLVLAAFLGRGLFTTVGVIGAVIWARPARILRSQVMRASQYQHVIAARAMGASTARILGRHILPRLVPLGAAQFVQAANIAVLLEASLAFLGLGDPNRISWGTMLFFANSHNAFLTRAWLWWILPPGLALTLVILGFAFVGYALEERADPRLVRSVSRGGTVTKRRKARAPSPAPAPERPAPTGPVLEVRDLVVEFGKGPSAVRAVDGASFSVERGKVAGLVGESGSGKSTIALCVLKLLRPPGRIVSGSVSLEGRDILSMPPSKATKLRGREVALIPQNAMNALNPAYTISRQVAEAAALTRNPEAAEARARELLERVGIASFRYNAYPHELSGGMRQRVTIAMALANEPSLLLADEPTTGLDVIVQARILRLLLDLKDQFGLSILVISHDLPTVARISDELMVMQNGRIVEEGPAQQVHSSPSHPYTQELVRAFPSLRGPRRTAGGSAAEPEADFSPAPAGGR
jgi:peptide/nickel transport system permease protein